MSERYTRDDYMGHRCTHRQYYAQFVTDAVKQAVICRFGIAKLQRSIDPHLNDIALQSWDNTSAPYSRQLFRELGDSWSQAGHVCILKEAARQAIEEAASTVPVRTEKGAL